MFRFILTRLWFFISIGGDWNDPLGWSRGVLVDCQEIVEGEIWRIEIDFSSHKETFYVLEQTCEVIGHPSLPSHPTDTPDSSPCSGNEPQLRSDWAAYIGDRVLPPSMHDSPPRSLLSHLRWSNYEEYERGISKLWLKKTNQEGEIGKEKREVAERYVLACIFGNR